MKKHMTFFIIFLISFLTSFAIFFIRSNLKNRSLSDQIDMKTGKANINWIVSDETSACKGLGSCRNYSSSSSSWGGGYGGGK